MQSERHASPTPGPWHVRTLENFGFNIVHYIGGDKFDIARVAKCSDVANANLIAASPALLEALEFLIEGLPDKPNSLGMYSLGAVSATAIDEARAAIHLARGAR